MDDVYYTVQAVGIGPVREEFRTKTRMSRPDQIVVTSVDPLFKTFEIRWTFKSMSQHSCHIDFRFECEMASFILGKIMNTMLDETARAMVRAFEDRARELLGNS